MHLAMIDGRMGQVHKVGWWNGSTVKAMSCGFCSAIVGVGGSFLHSVAFRAFALCVESSWTVVG